MNIALFRRALSNLLQNAIEHSAAGARLVVTISRRAGAIWIAVANPGRTIAAAHLPRLFDRFSRADTAQTSHIQGIGLGLSIARQLVEANGGQIVAQNRPGGGAVFSIRLPISEAMRLPGADSLVTGVPPRETIEAEVSAVKSTAARVSSAK